MRASSERAENAVWHTLSVFCVFAIIISYTTKAWGWFGDAPTPLTSLSTICTTTKLGSCCKGNHTPTFFLRRKNFICKFLLYM